MNWPIPRLIASLSRMTLQAGDVIWCGAPEARADEPSVRFGDQVESVVDRVGMIRNRVVG
jgi:2-keto-4-pentenoate hydratase/2-oxohepta-3-ene-1,7-dioic acid hydratase in catechol pathway